MTFLHLSQELWIVIIMDLLASMSHTRIIMAWRILIYNKS